MSSRPKVGERRLACTRGLFKLTISMTIAALWGGLHSVGASAQAPDEAWRTIRTQHFRVTFPETLEPLARRAADRAERAYAELEESFVESPNGLIDVLVTDHTDVSNGFAQVTPSNRITVFARPPVDALSLGYFDDWMELVITHELVHIVHLDYVTNPVGRLARAVFGRGEAEWPFFPELGQPRWITEGMATWYESRLTESGRVHGTFHDMQVRTALLEGRFEGIDQASGESPLWPGGNRPYAYGSLFFDFLLDKHGEERMSAFADAVAGQWVPYRIDAAGRDAFGASVSDEWRAWRSALEDEYSDLDERLARLGPVTAPERITTGARWGWYPTVSPDGRLLAYNRSDGRSDTQLRVADVGGEQSRQLSRTNGLSTFSWMPDGRLLFAQLDFADPYRVYSDLYITDMSGHQERLTHQARLSQPSVSADGAWAVAVRQGDGTNALVRVDLPEGRVSLLVAPDLDVHWALPRISPDGRWIAVTRWEPDAFHDLVILDARSGRIVDRVTRDRALDLAASWSPDSRWLVWSSDRTGILNIVGAEIEPGSGTASAPVMLTNVRTGAAYPSVDPTGQWLYFSGYHVDGWDVERVPFRPETTTSAPDASGRFDMVGSEPTRGSADQEMEEYRAGPTLGPTYWEVAYREPVVTPAVSTQTLSLRRRELLGFALGAQTSGFDLVGRHAWSALGRVYTSGGKVDGGFSYAYLGLGNPVLSVSATQSYEDGGHRLGGTTPDTLFVLERERALEGAVSFGAPKWRRNLTFTLSGGLVWENQELLGNDLEPTRTYNLPRPTSRLTDVAFSASFVTARTHSFQMGAARGVNVFVQGRARNELSLPDSLSGRVAVDRSSQQVIGRFRGILPLWGGGFATHVLAVQAAGGIASGPNAGPGFFDVGGASGTEETLTGAGLFGGRFILFPVRGYPVSSRFGRYAWTASAEYRFPLLLLNRGVGAWPLHFDRVIGSLFFDAGNAWGPDLWPTGFQNPLRTALASVGGEVTTEILGLYDVELRLRTGLALPLVSGSGVRGYVRVGLPF